jgi:hypothetical protein
LRSSGRIRPGERGVAIRLPPQSRISPTGQVDCVFGDTESFLCGWGNLSLVTSAAISSDDFKRAVKLREFVFS